MQRTKTLSFKLIVLLLIVGYFAVSAWNNLYDASSTGYSISFNANVENIISPPNVESDKFAQVSVGMKYDDVKELLGTVGKNIGYGTIVEQYVTEEQTVTISYYIRTDGHLYVSAIRR